MYTAVTRAKCNLWIYDSDKKKQAPVIDYWHKRGLVKVVGKNVEGKSQDSLMFASISTKEQWKVQGDRFKKKRRWEQAKHCYERSGAENEHLAKEAHAMVLLKRAQHANVNTLQTLQLYLHAAVLFIEADHIHHNSVYITYAASCLTKTKPPRYTDAARLLERLGEDKRAFSAYWKAEDAENCARLREKAGRYIEVVKILDHFNRKTEAFAKAVEYTERGILLDPDISVRVLKEGNLHRYAFEILVKHERYKEAFTLASAQKWYKEGISLAKEIKNSGMMAEFTFQKIKATHFKKSDKNINPEISSTLHPFTTSSDEPVRAHACLLLGILQRDVKLCREAEKTYKSFQHKVGELEAFNAIVELKQEISVPSIVHAYILAHTTKDMLHKNDSETVENALQFYGLQRIGNVYCCPPNQDIWIGTLSTCECQGKQMDLDGMIRLLVFKTKTALVDHCDKFTTKWQSHFELHQKLNSKLKQFKPHMEIYERKFLSHSFSSAEIPRDTLRDYIQTCVYVLELTDLKLIPTTDINPNILLLSIFSPQVSIYLPVGESHMAVVRRSKGAHRAIGKWIKSMVYENESKKITVDSWLTAWRASCIMNGKMKLLQTSYEVQAKKVIEEDKMVGTQIMQPLPLVYRYKEGEQQFYCHIFHFWIQSCQFVKDGNIFRSSQYVISDFLGNITRPSISIMNLVDILSVHCTALLTMVMCLDIFNHRGQTNVMVPLLYKHAIQVFDDLNNCTKGPSRRILPGCVKEVKQKEKEKEKEKESKISRSDCVKLLWAALDVVLGHESDQFSPHCMEQEQTLESSEARHLLILALTLFGNLILIEEEFPKEIAEYQQRFSIFFQTYLHRRQTAKYVEATHKCFESPNLTRETLFPLVQNLLLHSSPNSNAALGNLVLKYDKVEFEEIPRRFVEKLGDQGHVSQGPSPFPQVLPSMRQPISYASDDGAALHTAQYTTSSTSSGPIQNSIPPTVKHLTPFIVQRPSPHAQPGHDTATFHTPYMQPPIPLDPAIEYYPPDPNLLHQHVPTHEVHRETKPLLLNGDNFKQGSQPLQPIKQDPSENQLLHTATYASIVTQQSKDRVVGAPDGVPLITTESPLKYSQDQSEFKMQSFNADVIESTATGDSFPNESHEPMQDEHEDEHALNLEVPEEQNGLNDTLVSNLTVKDAEDPVIGEAAVLHTAQTECKLKQPAVEPAEVEDTLFDAAMMEMELASEAPLRSKEKKEHSREAKRKRKKGRDKKAT